MFEDRLWTAKWDSPGARGDPAGEGEVVNVDIGPRASLLALVGQVGTMVGRVLECESGAYLLEDDQGRVGRVSQFVGEYCRVQGGRGLGGYQ